VNNKVRILHITERHAKSRGGVPTVVNDLTEHLYQEGVYSVVMAATDKDEPVPEGVGFIKMGERCNQLSALWSPDLKHDIQDVIQKHNINVIHIHCVWMPLQVVASRLAKSMNIPFIITPHGSFNLRIWKGKGISAYLKKKLYFYFLSYPAYKNAEYIHSITPDEGVVFRHLFPFNKQALIPNAIDMNQTIDTQVEKIEKVVFFIGRLNPIKGVELLLQAFAALSCSNEWKLIIAGPAEVPEYKKSLEIYIRENGLDERVKLVGSVYGEEKESWYRKAWVTVVPSYSEVVGMVNLESAVFECPSITTKETGLFDWEEGGGLLVSPNKESLLDALYVAVGWSEEERQARGKLSYKLVENHYSWQSTIKQWLNTYREVCRK